MYSNGLFAFTHGVGSYPTSVTWRWFLPDMHTDKKDWHFHLAHAAAIHFHLAHVTHGRTCNAWSRDGLSGQPRRISFY